jgi:hypothetical protein
LPLGVLHTHSVIQVLQKFCSLFGYPTTARFQSFSMSRPEQMMLGGPAQHYHHAAAAAAACNMSFATEYFVDVFTASFSNRLNSVVESIRIWFYYWFVARLNFSTPKHRKPVTNT